MKKRLAFAGMIALCSVALFLALRGRQRSNERILLGAATENVPTQNIADTRTEALAEPAGGEALMLVDGKYLHARANPRGEYERVRVPANRLVATEIHLPDFATGAPVVLEAEDGGALSTSQVLVSPSHRVAFNFAVPADSGSHRVTLRWGGRQKVLEYWTGQEPPLRRAN